MCGKTEVGRQENQKDKMIHCKVCNEPASTIACSRNRSDSAGRPKGCILDALVPAFAPPSFEIAMVILPSYFGQEENLTKSLEHPQTGSIHPRQFSYGLLGLPHYQQVQIMQDAGVLEGLDTNTPGVEWLIICIKRAKETGKLEAIKKAVLAATKENQ